MSVAKVIERLFSSNCPTPNLRRRKQGLLDPQLPVQALRHIVYIGENDTRAF